MGTKILFRTHWYMVLLARSVSFVIALLSPRFETGKQLMGLLPYQHILILHHLDAGPLSSKQDASPDHVFSLFSIYF